jgi:hypothetical protein
MVLGFVRCSRIIHEAIQASFLKLVIPTVGAIFWWSEDNPNMEDGFKPRRRAAPPYRVSATLNGRIKVKPRISGFHGWEGQSS